MERPLNFLGKTTFRLCGTSLELVFGGSYSKDRIDTRTANKYLLWFYCARTRRETKTFKLDHNQR